ncbi:hypothetical protein [Streptomyces sioyaensis]|uniref:hypothetical protein n=1 Tax=Streptomyces sioyaensis TaxID=67364 RepID=UPI003D70881A
MASHRKDLSRLLAREKPQRDRAAVKKLLGHLGFDNSEALTEFVTAKREADQAALTEVERHEQVAEGKLRAAEAREAEAVARTALRTAFHAHLPPTRGDGPSPGPDRTTTVCCSLHPRGCSRCLIDGQCLTQLDLAIGEQLTAYHG